MAIIHSIFAGALLTASALFPVTSAFQINWYSDGNCQNYIGSDSGGQDAQSVAYAGLECNAANQGANSFIAMVDQCQSVEVWFGARRAFESDCWANGFVCQFGTVRYRNHNQNNCVGGLAGGVSGWQMTFNLNEGNCPYGYKKRSEEGINATEVLGALEVKGPENELELNLLERREELTKRIQC